MSAVIDHQLAAQLTDAELYAIHRAAMAERDQWLRDPGRRCYDGQAEKAVYLRSVIKHLAAATAPVEIIDTRPRPPSQPA